MAANPAATLRKRHLTAAKRSLKLIRDEAEAADVAFADGGVPDGSGFQASVTRYDKALAVLNILDVLGDDGETAALEAEEESSTAEVQLDDLEALVLLVRDFVTEAGANPDEDGTALARLTRAAFPGGIATAQDGQAAPDAGWPPMSSEDM